MNSCPTFWSGDTDYPMEMEQELNKSWEFEWEWETAEMGMEICGIIVGLNSHWQL